MEENIKKALLVLEPENKNKPKEKSDEELSFDSVVNDGDSGFLYDLGPFSRETITYIIDVARENEIPISIYEVNTNSCNGQNNKNDELKVKILKELNQLNSHLANTNNKKKNKKEFEKLLKKRDSLGNKLNQLNCLAMNHNYHIYVNSSQIEFIQQVLKNVYSQVKQEFDQDGRKDEDIYLPRIDQKIELEDLKVPGNFGTLMQFYLAGEDVFEMIVRDTTYVNLRNDEKISNEHIAIKYSNTDTIRMIFEADKLLEYLYHLCQVKDIHEEIYICYIHGNDEYKIVDKHMMPSIEHPVISDIKIPFSISKLQKIKGICVKESIPMSFQIFVPKGDLGGEDCFTKLSLIIRSTLDISKHY